MNNEQAQSYDRSPRTPFVQTPIHTGRNQNNTSFISNDNSMFNNFDVTPWRQTYDITSFSRNYELMNRFIDNDQQNLFDDMSLPMILDNPIVNPRLETPKMEKKLSFDDDEPIEQNNCQKKMKQEEPITGGKSIEIFQTVRKTKQKPIDYEALATTAKKLKFSRSFKEQTKKKSNKEKGLRVLSQRAHEIVMQMKAATYKEVAVKLYEQFLPENQLASSEKEQKNIKRRVYDALNVLIALGVLNKDGRKIVSNKKSLPSLSQKINKQDIIQQHGKVFQSYYKLKKNLQQKRINVQIANKNYKAMKSLIDRNKTFETNSQETIPFPIIGIQVPGVKQEEIQLTDNTFRMLLPSKFAKKFGDLDIVNYLEFAREKKQYEMKK